MKYRYKLLCFQQINGDVALNFNRTDEEGTESRFVLNKTYIENIYSKEGAPIEPTLRIPTHSLKIISSGRMYPEFSKKEDFKIIIDEEVLLSSNQTAVYFYLFSDEGTKIIRPQQINQERNWVVIGKNKVVSYEEMKKYSINIPFRQLSSNFIIN